MPEISRGSSAATPPVTAFLIWTSPEGSQGLQQDGMHTLLADVSSNIYTSYCACGSGTPAGVQLLIFHYRGYRFAQPPANLYDPSRVDPTCLLSTWLDLPVYRASAEWHFLKI